MSSSLRARRSLRSILSLWFLIFSIVPLSFVTGYSLVQFESAINEELNKRLKGNSREVEVVLNDLESYLSQGGQRHAADPSFVYQLSTVSVPNVRRLVSGWMDSYEATRISIFDREGRLIVALEKGEGGKHQTLTKIESGDFYLPEGTTTQLKNVTQLAFRDIRAKYGLEILVYTKVTTAKGLQVGFIEETITLDPRSLEGLKKRLNVDVILFDSELRPVMATRDDFTLVQASFFKEQMRDQKESFFELSSRDAPFGTMLTQIKSATSSINIGLAVSKKEAKSVTQGINRALVSIVGVIVLLLLVTLFAASNLVMKPINHLVEAAQRIENGELGTQIEVESETEIGLLTQTFNKMSARIAEARKQLESKIIELETANKELQETQAQLVQSAKMVSLGQLVAGIAHELNNPISFIYSNMTHLRDYGDRLMKLVDAAENSPGKLDKLKEELEFTYIEKDLPKLISSCEDGARRVRDIVIGLRNFSRIEEHQAKEVNLLEGIQTTLGLLSGEFKNRIEVFTDLKALPLVHCYPNQINQVFMNLLTNAAQAIEGEGKIHIRSRRVQDDVEITVSDSGKGISQQNLDRIFDPFFTTKPVGQGTGLGLSISYGIIQKHNGQLLVKSEIGKGTEFTIRLPIKSQI